MFLTLPALAIPVGGSTALTLPPEGAAILEDFPPSLLPDPAMARVLSRHSITAAVTPATHTYLSCSDLFLRQTWCACALGFDYEIQAAEFCVAAKALATACPELTGRWV